jgi:multidrug resistance efflux pump
VSERTTHPLLREVANATAPEPPPPVSQAPAVAPPVEEKAPPSTAPANVEADAARYRRRVLLTLSAVVLALFLYWASGYFFAYTDDAYVTSDFVNVAPYISGRIVSVNIVDNQTVTKGELLATIDPTPFSWR